MERIVLEVSPALARQWAALSDKEKTDLSPRLEKQLRLLLSGKKPEEDSLQTAEKLNEPSATYQTSVTKKDRKRPVQKMTQEEIDELMLNWGCGRPDEAEMKREIEETRKRLPEIEKFFDELSDKVEARGFTPEKLAKLMEWDENTFESLFGRKPNYGV